MENPEREVYLDLKASLGLVDKLDNQVTKENEVYQDPKVHKASKENEVNPERQAKLVREVNKVPLVLMDQAVSQDPVDLLERQEHAEKMALTVNQDSQEPLERTDREDPLVSNLNILRKCMTKYLI